MRIITLNRKSLLIGILVICLIWLAYVCLQMVDPQVNPPAGEGQIGTIEEVNGGTGDKEPEATGDGESKRAVNGSPAEKAEGTSDSEKEGAPKSGSAELNASSVPTAGFEMLPETSKTAAYFVNYRIEREKLRSRQLEILNEMVDNSKSTDDVRSKAQEKLLTITQAMEDELKLENLLLAKNYQDAAVFIQPESVLVVVPDSGIGNLDRVKIADLVSNTTGHSFEDIFITTKN